jgi:hypothetical protein
VRKDAVWSAGKVRARLRRVISLRRASRDGGRSRQRRCRSSA